MGVWSDLGISSGTGILVVIALYFVIKWAVRNGIEEAYSNITGKKTASEIVGDEMLNSYGYGTEDEEHVEVAEEV